MGVRQQTFSDIEYSNRRKKTRREEFLESMDEMILWEHWVGIIRPYYPTGKRGRSPKDIEAMLRMYLMQNWFSLSDEGIEDAIYDSHAMCISCTLTSSRNRCRTSRPSSTSATWSKKTVSAKRSFPT